MKFSMLYVRLCIAGVLILSCDSASESKGPAGRNNPVISTKKAYVKPPASGNDTLTINYTAAVFYYPDSLQLLKIKAQTDSMAFDGSTHEYFYQMRNARMVLKKEWPGIKMIEARRYRFLLFIKKNQVQNLVDLNSLPDPYGLIVFDRVKDPTPVDMTNIETILHFYFK